MAPTKVAAEKDPTSLDGGIVKRRNRIPVSCESCRSRKLKCDRQKPCQNCKARDFATCIYAAQDGIKSSAGGHHAGGMDEMGDRLNRLEALVSSMAKSPSSSLPDGLTALPSVLPARPRETGGEAYPSVETAMETSAPYGAMVSASEGNHFVGSTHWQAILTDIAAIKEHLEDGRAARSLQLEDSDQPAIFGGVLRSVTRAELLASLPARSLSNRLVTRFFDVYDPSIPYSQFLHQATFLKQYEAFWADFDAWPVAKIGMLYSILNLALHSHQRYGDAPPDIHAHVLSMAESYRYRAAQCILAANLGTPTFDSVLGMKLYALSEYARLPYSDVQHWMVHGLVMRQALRAGFHRDPSAFPSITPFEAEQRRRIWHSICQLDLLMSLQLGLPSMTRYSESNVAPPRSVYEEELYEGMPELPLARPPDEPTPVAYMIAKQRIFQVVARVVEHLNTVRVPADDAVLDLTRDLDAARDAVPPHLRHKPWDQSVNDAVPLRLQRMHLQIFYDKALCLLNRRFLAVPVHARARFARSRALCIRAALSLLSIQADMHRLGVKWYAYTLSRTDYLLATAILCRTLHAMRSSSGSFTGGNGDRDTNGHDPAAQVASTDAEEAQIRDALSRARAIWEQISDVSTDARPVCRIISSMLEKVPGMATSAPGPATTDVSPVPSLVESRSGHGGEEASSARADTTSTMSGTPDDLRFSDMMDWSTWDSIIQSSGFDSFENVDQLWGP